MSLAIRSPVRLKPDPDRVIATRFIPGEDLPEDHSRISAVIERVLLLSDEDVRATLAEVTARFAGRHLDLGAIFERNFEAVASRLREGAGIPEERAALIGAYFTHEVTPEGASLTNPSMVAHPDQGGLPAGAVRFVLSARAVGEGHVSRLEFRTGVIGAGLDIAFDPTGHNPVVGRRTAMHYDRRTFDALLAGVGCDAEVMDLVLGPLGPRFDQAALDESIAGLRHVLTRQSARDTFGQLDWVAANNYEVTFDPATTIDERVLVPVGSTEKEGLEDARFVRFLDDDGIACYYATYTAYDGARVAPQLLETEDFRTFRVRQLSGPAARNKGMALFPRRIAGRYVSLSRWDRESSSVSTSDDASAWDEPITIQVPQRPWELVQIGNCGSPIETPEGWLVLTHGVGPMRTYAIGAVLLALDDPSRVIGALPTPLLAPTEEERGGYVPNVLYSCGSLLHGETVVLPYGFGDRAIGFALVPLPRLLEELLAAGC